MEVDHDGAWQHEWSKMFNTESSSTHNAAASSRAADGGVTIYDYQDDDEEDATNDDATNDGATNDAPVVRGVIDVSCFSDYNDDIMGHNVVAKVPELGVSPSMWLPWKEFARSREEIRPVRTLVWNIPVSLFARHSQKFHHWTTPQKNALRAAHIAAVVSFCFTGTSKGFRSGQHEDKQRHSDTGGDKSDAPKKCVDRYMFMSPADNNRSLPMFTIGYEELYDPTLTTVVAIRVYKFVFDKTHSDSELFEKLSEENLSTFNSACLAHTQSKTRHKNLLNEQKHVRLHSCATLEKHAGTQYHNIHTLAHWLSNLTSYGGEHNVHHNGRPFFDARQLPIGMINKDISADPVLGGRHPLAPEYVFNAKRERALSAGLVELNNEIIEVHPDFLNPRKYWKRDGVFKPPAASRNSGGFFLLGDPSVTNVFDAPLPRPIYGAASPGVRLLELYEERNPEEVSKAGGTSSAVCDCFNNMMKEQDPLAVELQRCMAETAITYDTIDVPDHMRNNDYRHYGERDMSDNAYIIEPVQFFKTLQHETRRVLSELIQGWRKDRETLRNSKYDEIIAMRDKKNDVTDDDYAASDMQPVRDIENETNQKNCEVMKALILLHLSRAEEALNSQLQRKTIPSGYLAMYDGLQAELAKMPNRTATIAWAQDVSLTFSDMSSFAHTHMWLGAFWEKDTFVEGRDRRIMVSSALHTTQP